MSAVIRRLLNVAAPVLLVVILAAACSSDGFPVGYNDQDDPGTGLTLVQSNWIKGCEVGLSENLAEEANSVCQCSYERLSVPGGIPFEQFVELNAALKDDPTSLGSGDSLPGEPELLEIVKNCIAG